MLRCCWNLFVLEINVDERVESLRASTAMRRRQYESFRNQRSSAPKCYAAVDIVKADRSHVREFSWISDLMKNIWRFETLKDCFGRNIYHASDYQTGGDVAVSRCVDLRGSRRCNQAAVSDCFQWQLLVLVAFCRGNVSVCLLGQLTHRRLTSLAGSLRRPPWRRLHSPHRSLILISPWIKLAMHANESAQHNQKK